MVVQNKKTFAFQLASQQKTANTQWQARDGVAVAGCTDPTREGDFRESIDVWGNYRGRDKGYWC